MTWIEADELRCIADALAVGLDGGLPSDRLPWLSDTLHAAYREFLVYQELNDKRRAEEDLRHDVKALKAAAAVLKKALRPVRGGGTRPSPTLRRAILDARKRSRLKAPSHVRRSGPIDQSSKRSRTGNKKRVNRPAIELDSWEPAVALANANFIATESVLAVLSTMPGILRAYAELLPRQSDIAHNVKRKRFEVTNGRQSSERVLVRALMRIWAEVHGVTLADVQVGSADPPSRLLRYLSLTIGLVRVVWGQPSQHPNSEQLRNIARAVVKEAKRVVAGPK